MTVTLTASQYDDFFLNSLHYYTHKYLHNDFFEKPVKIHGTLSGI